MPAVKFTSSRGGGEGFGKVNAALNPQDPIQGRGNSPSPSHGRLEDASEYFSHGGNRVSKGGDRR